MKKLILLIASSWILLFCCIGSASATTILSPTIGGSIGTSGIPPTPDHITGYGFVNTGGSDVHRDVIEFDVSSLSAESTEFTLHLTYTAFRSDFGTYMLSSFEGDGAITLADWGRDVSFISTFETMEQTTELLSFDVTPALVFAGDFVGFRIEGVSTNSGNIRVDYQLEAAPAPIPEPVTMLLLGTGIAGLAGTGLRRKKKSIQEGWA